MKNGTRVSEMEKIPNEKGPKVRFIEIQVAFETEDEFNQIMERIREVLPPNFHKISWDKWFNKPNGWKGFEP